MPSPAKFLHAFGLIKNKGFNHATIIDVDTSHEVIERYKKYQFHITIKFDQLGAESAIKHLTSLSLVVNSDYGNPYRCTLQLLNNNGLTFHLLGTAIRIQ